MILESSLSFWYWEGDTLTNGDFLYKYKFPWQKGNFYSVFRASPVSAFSQKNNPLKVIYTRDIFPLVGNASSGILGASWPHFYAWNYILVSGALTTPLQERGEGKGWSLFLNFYFILFFYFWLCWVFVATRGLSLVVVSRGYSSLRCPGFSLRWLLLLRSTGSDRKSVV